MRRTSSTRLEQPVSTHSWKPHHGHVQRTLYRNMRGRAAHRGDRGQPASGSLRPGLLRRRSLESGSIWQRASDPLCELRRPLAVILTGHKLKRQRRH